MLGPPGHSDWQKYPYREINKSDSIFNFQKELNSDEIESLFEHKFRSLGVSSFDEYINKTRTNALIVIKNDTVIYEENLQARSNVERDGM